MPCADVVIRAIGFSETRHGFEAVGEGLICKSGWRHCCGSEFGIITGSARGTIKGRDNGRVYGTGTVRGAGLITGVSTGTGKVLGTIIGTCAGDIRGVIRGTNSSSVNCLVTGCRCCTQPEGVINQPAGQFGLVVLVYVRVTKKPLYSSTLNVISVVVGVIVAGEIPVHLLTSGIVGQNSLSDILGGIM